MFVYLLSLLVNLAFAQYTVVSPQDGQEFLTGSDMTIEVTDSTFPPPDPPETFSMNLLCSSAGNVTTPAYSFNTTNTFTIPNDTRGSCTASFITNSVVFDTLTLIVNQSYVFTSNVTSGLAGSSFPYEAYTTPPTAPFVVVEQISCPQGSVSFQILVNGGVRQSTLPPAYSGLCYYETGASSVADYYTSVPFAVYIYNPLTIEVVSADSVPPGGSTVTLLVYTPTYHRVRSVTLTLTCPTGGSVSQVIYSSTSSTDYIYFQTGKDQKGNCLFTESGFPDNYQPTTAKFIIIDPLWYYFPMNRLVELPRHERRRRRHQ